MIDSPDAQLLVSAGPRGVLQYIGGILEQRDRRIDVVDAIGARDRLFPDGGWTLQALRARIIQGGVDAQAGLDYLVLVSRETDESEVTGGLMTPYWRYDKTTLTAALLSLRSGATMKQFESSAGGRGFGVFAPVYGFMVAPRIDYAATKGMANAIIDSLRQTRPEGIIRVGVLALQTIDPRGPFAWGYEGAVGTRESMLGTDAVYKLYAGPVRSDREVAVVLMTATEAVIDGHLIHPWDWESVHVLPGKYDMAFHGSDENCRSHVMLDVPLAAGQTYRFKGQDLYMGEKQDLQSVAHSTCP